MRILVAARLSQLADGQPGLSYAAVMLIVVFALDDASPRPATPCASAPTGQNQTLTLRAPRTSASPANSPRQPAPTRPVRQKRSLLRQAAPGRPRPRGRPRPSRNTATALGA